MYIDNSGLWAKMRGFARQFGAELNDMDAMFGLEKGTLTFMAENGIVPEDEILRRFEQFTGLTAMQLVSNIVPEEPLDVPKSIFVLKDAEFVKDYQSLEHVIGRVCIDVPSWDRAEYIGIMVWDDAMSRARVFEGDIAVIRRQAVAQDGDIVVAEVDGVTVLRRYHQAIDVMWLEAEGKALRGKVHYSENLSSLERKIRIYGRLVSVVRVFE